MDRGRTRTRLGIVWGALALAAVALGACTTPTIPIPPPRPGDLSFEADAIAGEATFSSFARAEFSLARVAVYDRTSGEGVIATAELDGSVLRTRPFAGVLGDEVEILVTREDESAGICVVLRTGMLTDADRCTE